MADNLGTMLAGVKFKKMDSYKARLLEGSYDTNRELAISDLDTVLKYRRRLSKLKDTVPPKAYEDIDTIARLIERAIGTRTNTAAAIPELAPARNNSAIVATAAAIPELAPARNNLAATMAASAAAAPLPLATEERREVAATAAVGLTAAVNLGSGLAPVEENRPAEPEVTPEQQYVERIQLLDLKLAECTRECKALSDEKRALEEFNRRSEIAGISLPASSKLFDLLRDRILDPAEDWATRLETLINIPHSTSGAAYLRGGDYFEALFQIAIAIGELPTFRDKFVRFHDIAGYKVMREFKNYLYVKDVKNSGGGEQGISDITFELSNTPEFTWKPSSSYKCGVSPKEDGITANPFYFISVKGFKKEKSPAKEYDIPLLNLQLSVFPEIEHKHIIVCVRNKAKLLEKLSRTKMDMLKHSINKVIGYDDLIETFTALRLKIFTKLGTDKPTPDTVDELLRKLYPENRVVKPMLSLYFHQELVVNSVMEQISIGGRRDAPHYLCIGVLPRGGKSFIAGGIINKHKLHLESLTSSASASAAAAPRPVGYNVLFLTSAVNETRSQFREDLISKFSEFSDFKFIDLVDAHREEEGENNFYFISRQLSTSPAALVAEEEGPEVSLLNEKRAEPNILATLERKLGRLPRFDICFFDEAHIGIAAESVRKNFDTIFSSLPGIGIPIILMTATYKRPSAVLRSNSDLFVWDLQDIKDMKSLPVLGLEDFIRSSPDVLARYPHAVDLLQRRVSMGESLEQLAKPYVQFANPNFISLTFAPSDIQKMIERGAGYNYMNAFEINQNEALLSNKDEYDNWWSLLRNREDSNNLLQFLTPELETDDTIFTGESRHFRALNQIFRIAQKNSSRPIQGRPFSILMFLPFRQAEKDGSKGPIRIGELCRIWASFMRTKRYWRENFVFLTLSSYGKHTSTRPTIEQAVEKGIVHRDDYKKDLKDLIRETEKEALKKDKGLVILSGDVAKMGISLPCVDVVFMMGNNPDADDIIQKMYRALTDDPPQKKDGFIVDLNLKRIVSAMFDYDLQKDKLRTSVVQLPSIEDRAMRLFNLCDWGQDSFIEDTAGITFDDVMKAIKDRIVTSLRNKVMEDNTDKKIQDKQENVFLEIDGFIEEIQRTLGGTIKAKGRRGVTEKLLTRGTTIPGRAAGGAGAGPTEEVGEGGEAASGEGDGAAPVSAPPPPMLDPKEAQKRMFEIIQTFINTLVIRSAESWSSSSMNLAALMELYWKNKATSLAEPECECKGSSECKTIHKNIYEQVFCELKAFAYEIIETSRSTLLKPQYTSAPVFNPNKHRKIIAYAEDILRTPLIEWNIYIEKLLKDLQAQVGGRRYRVTRRRKTNGISKGNGVRKTLQQRSRHN
jgi:hypothetical protein